MHFTPPLILFNHFAFLLFFRRKTLFFFSYSLFGNNIELVHWLHTYVAVDVPRTYCRKSYNTENISCTYKIFTYIAVDVSFTHWRHNYTIVNVDHVHWQHSHDTVNIPKELGKLFYVTEIISSVQRSIYNQRTNYSLTFSNTYN